MRAGIAVAFVVFGIAFTIIAGYFYLSYLYRPESQSVQNLTRHNSEMSFSVTIKKDRWTTPNVYIEPNKMVAVGCGKNPCTVCVSEKCVTAKIKDENFYAEIITGEAEADENVDVKIANYELLQIKLDSDSFVESSAVNVLVKSHISQKEPAEPSNVWGWLWFALKIVGGVSLASLILFFIFNPPRIYYRIRYKLLCRL